MPLQTNAPNNEKTRQGLEQLSLGNRGKFRVLDERVQEVDEFSHQRCQGELLGLALGAEAFLAGFESRIVSAGHQRGHVENSSRSGSPGTDRALASPRTTVSIEWSNSG